MLGKQVVIIGGGFAGLQVARHLENTNFSVLLLDKQNHHQFQPLFYQVASARIEPSSISFPFRKLFQKSRNVDFRLAEVTRIDSDHNQVFTNVGVFPYDYLVIACGCKTNFFGNQELSENALAMKTTGEAISIRNHILENFEKMISAHHEKEALENIVIAGAGPTGVELAGAFAEMKRYILPRDYPKADFSKMKIYLLDGSPKPLANMSSNAQWHSQKFLEELGVTVRTDVIVKNYNGDAVELSDGTSIQTKNLIWAAGVTGNALPGLEKSIVVRGNRYTVDRYNKVKGYDDVYAIGDIAYMETPKFPKGHPQVANVAINQGKNLAINFAALQKGKSLKEYEYRDLGAMATIGKHRAVVDFPFVHFGGRFAWFIWMFLHLMLILSVRNKLIVFINWSWNYFTQDSSLRLILRPK